MLGVYFSTDGESICYHDITRGRLQLELQDQCQPKFGDVYDSTSDEKRKYDAPV